MENKKKGLADTQDGEFILNESGTSVSTDNVESPGETPAGNIPEPIDQESQIKELAKGSDERKE